MPDAIFCLTPRELVEVFTLGILVGTVIGWRLRSHKQ